MSSALAIAAVSAALKDLLNDGLLNHDLSKVGNFSVSALPPDRIVTTPSEPNQLNLFMHHLSPNQGWRNAGLPARDEQGRRLANPPLALDLHYMLTAWGSEDLHAEILLGYAMQILHRNPVLTRAQLRTSLGGVPPLSGALLPPGMQALAAADLAEQVELIKITPSFPSTEELSKFWTAMQTKMRPSMAYSVSVVLLQDNLPTRQALPVLARGPQDQGFSARAAWPQLHGVRVEGNPRAPAMRLGDTLALQGAHLNLCSDIELLHPASGMQRILTPQTSPSGALLAQLPEAGAPKALSEWAIGIWEIALRAQLDSGHTLSSQRLQFALAPRIKLAANNFASANFNLNIECSPRLLPEQEKNLELLFGNFSLRPAKVSTPNDVNKPSTLKFEMKKIPPGQYVVRLRVDGVDSLPVQLGGNPPQLAFDPQQTVSVK
ncbi:DUF4255 domain-containing protein [Massilia sp. W12]|uniref:DUF4255 domain-containing protein n=1 Tax=Massilia sp. W12 TaxID=3126507 RepID=UPI0030D5AB45